MENKLISMCEYIELQESEVPLIPDTPTVKDMDRIFVQRTILYMRFLKQPLELWMFVPCKLVDGDWVVLKKPDADYYMMVTDKDLKEYQEAKERCLFEGFKYNDGCLVNGMSCVNLKIHHNVEQIIVYNIVLTPTALKQIGL